MATKTVIYALLVLLEVKSAHMLAKSEAGGFCTSMIRWQTGYHKRTDALRLRGGHAPDFRSARVTETVVLHKNSFYGEEEGSLDDIPSSCIPVGDCMKSSRTDAHERGEDEARRNDPKDLCLCKPDQGNCDAADCNGASSSNRSEPPACSASMGMNTSPPPSFNEGDLAEHAPVGSSVSSSGWALGDLGNAYAVDEDVFADMRIRLRAAASEIRRRAEHRHAARSCRAGLAKGGGDTEDKESVEEETRGMEAKCVKCCVAIPSDREWVMAGDKPHCSVRCAEETAERFIDGLQRTDGLMGGDAPQILLTSI